MFRNCILCHEVEAACILSSCMHVNAVMHICTSKQVSQGWLFILWISIAVKIYIVKFIANAWATKLHCHFHCNCIKFAVNAWASSIIWHECMVNYAYMYIWMDIEYKCDCIVSIEILPNSNASSPLLINAKPIHCLRVQMHAKCDASSAFYLKTLSWSHRKFHCKVYIMADVCSCMVK